MKTLLLSPYPDPGELDPYLARLVARGVEWQMTAIENAEEDIWLALGTYQFTRPLRLHSTVRIRVGP